MSQKNKIKIKLMLQPQTKLEYYLTRLPHRLHILAPRVSKPVEAFQLVISELQVLATNIRRLFLQGNKPRSLLQHLKRQNL